MLPSAPGTARPEQESRYVIRENKTWVITTDPLGNISEQGADGRGNITRVRRLDKGGKELTTAGYVYNGLGEMLKAVDADGNPLAVEYDRLGRRTKMTSADIGTKQWWYDASGNVVAEADGELVRKGKRIQYEYDGLNRLTKINYPYSEAVVYEYGGYSAGGREDNAAGRVTRVRDESGSIEYKYGKLGQVEREHRVIKLLPLSSGKTKSGEMKYASDYLGRMKEITYPDGEVVRYGYGYGGQIKSVTGERIGTKFDYVTNIGYDEYGQRVYIMYGNGAETEYKYDPYRRWLSGLDTNSGNAGKVQDMKYNFDSVGNVLGYENNARGYTTKQSYSYDALYQLTGVQGTSRSHPYGGNEEYKTDYRQKFDFNRIGNMTNKISEESVSNTNRVGAELNYALEYEYYKGTHKAERIGNRYYDYDLNGNVLAEREGSHAVNKEADRAYYQEGDKYWADYGFGLVKPKPDTPDDGVYQRNYKWNERNLLSETSDNTYTVQYRYGADGQRALKLNAASGRSVVYFNKMWQTSDSRMEWLQSKHIYLNEDRIATKYNSEGNINTQAEKERTYYYHSDHLGSAQVVTNWKGQIHERLEYTPYGELWIDWKGDTGLEDKTPFRFTGKEMDAETGFYYYGARYLDPKTSRWISADPALGEYVPVAPVDDEARKRNGNLPGQGGVFNYVNLHVYHYAGNNPVKYVDPDGRSPGPSPYNMPNTLAPSNIPYNSQIVYQNLSLRKEETKARVEGLDQIFRSSSSTILSIWRLFDKFADGGKYRNIYIRMQIKAKIDVVLFLEDARKYLSHSDSTAKYTIQEAETATLFFNNTMYLKYYHDLDRLGPYKFELQIPYMSDKEVYDYLNYGYLHYHYIIAKPNNPIKE